MTNQIDVQELQRLTETNPIKIVDGSWALDGTDMRNLFLTEHLPAAVFFDIEDIRDHTSPLPHMAPSPEVFGKAMGSLGISNDDHVVIYDRQGLFSAARVWWTFRLMGHQKVQVLKGGLPAWKAVGLPVTSESYSPAPTTYTPVENQEMVINLNNLREISNTKNPPAIFDARPSARFDGVMAEPRPGLRSGHMPGARSLPASDLMRDGALRPVEELRAIFRSLELSDDQSVVTTCGSGVTAAIITLALHEAGYAPGKLYDGSWAEWGQKSLDTPVVITEGA